MTTIERLRALARELAGEAWDYDRRRLPAQAHVRRLAASAVMNQADSIRDEDAIFEVRPPIELPRSVKPAPCESSPSFRTDGRAARSNRTPDTGSRR